MNQNDLEQSKINKALVESELKILSCIKPLLNSSIDSLSMFERNTTFIFREPLDLISVKRLKALGFSVNGSTAIFVGRLCQSVDFLSRKIERRFNGSTVTRVVIDDEFASLTATVDGVTFVCCGHLEDYA